MLTNENGCVSIVNGIRMKNFSREELQSVAFHFHLQGSYTPLHIAAQGGHNETCEVLIANGAEMNAPTEVRSKFFLPCAE